MKKNYPYPLSVIIPVYNEKDTIAELVRRVRQSPVKKQIIIVDEASTDGTTEVIKKEILPLDRHIAYFRHDKTRGKGAAIRTGLGAVKGEVVVIQDADLEYDPGDYQRLVDPILEGRTDVVYGSRFLNVHGVFFLWHWLRNRLHGGKYPIRYLHHYLGIRFLNFLVFILYFKKITDEATCYKAIRSSVLKSIPLECEGFEFCPEVTAKLLKRGHGILEVPVSYEPRSKREGKKINWTHGFQAMFTLLKYRFGDQGR